MTVAAVLTSARIGQVLFVALLVLFLLGFAVRLTKRSKTNKAIKQSWEESEETEEAKETQETENEEEFEEPPLLEKHVTVMDKVCVSEVVGVRYPKHRDVYQLAVRYDDGTTELLTVEKMIFDSVPLHSNGTLAFVGGRVFGYCQDI